MSIARPITEKAILMEKVVDPRDLRGDDSLRSAWAQGAGVRRTAAGCAGRAGGRGEVGDGVGREGARFESVGDDAVAAIVEKLRRAQRPVILLGAGVERATTDGLMGKFEALGVPLMVTWNAMDRIGAEPSALLWAAEYVGDALLEYSDAAGRHAAGSGDAAEPAADGLQLAAVRAGRRGDPCGLRPERS